MAIDSLSRMFLPCQTFCIYFCKSAAATILTGDSVLFCKEFFSFSVCPTAQVVTILQDHIVEIHGSFKRWCFAATFLQFVHRLRIAFYYSFTHCKRAHTHFINWMPTTI